MKKNYCRIKKEEVMHDNDLKNEHETKEKVHGKNTLVKKRLKNSTNI